MTVGPSPGAGGRPGEPAPAPLSDVLLEVFEAQRLGRAPGPGVRVGLRAVCADAHRRGVPVTQLLVALKAAWWVLPPVTGIPRPDAEAALARVITLCIGEFYRGDDAATGTRLDS